MENSKFFGKRCGFCVPTVNIGTMRLPEDHDEAVALIRHAIDSGMRYIDTSCGNVISLIKVGKALKDGYREKVILSTKCSPWITMVEETDDTSADCTRRRIEESMARLDVNYLDFYQVWNSDSREHYAGMKTSGAEACENCGKCEEKCTQHLSIMAKMAYAAKKFGGGL